MISNLMMRPSTQTPRLPIQTTPAGTLPAPIQVLFSQDGCHRLEILAIAIQVAVVTVRAAADVAAAATNWLTIRLSQNRLQARD